MILCADLHLRRTVPRARTDDYFVAQERKFRFILEQAQASPPLLVAGDIFDAAKSPQFIEQWVISLLMEYGVVPIVTPGQHDLPNHNLLMINESSLGVLAAAGVVKVLTKESGPAIIGEWAIWGCAYGESPDESMVDQARHNLLLWHQMIIKGGPLWPGQVADEAEKVLRMNEQYRIICTGDNHITHITQVGGRYLVNPGSMMRMTTAQVDHKPCVFKYDNGNIERIFLPIEPNILDLSVTDAPKDKADRFGAFVEQLQGGGEIGISFDDNLKRYFSDHPEEPQVQELVWEARGD